MTNTCDGKKCDDTAVPCSFAKQVIYSLKCDLKDAREKLSEADDRGFYGGVLACLQILCLHDSHTQAMEVVNCAGGIKKIESYAILSGSDVDMETVQWLKMEKRELNKQTGGGA